MYDALTDAEAAFLRYEDVRHRLPRARFAAEPVRAGTLAEVAHRYDAFILDAFGVLNVGETPIPGAIGRMADLRAMGKRLVVLTNAASYTRAEAVAKYARLGFDFGPDEVVSSRDVAVARLPALSGTWGAFAAAGDTFGDIAADVGHAIDEPSLFDAAGGFLFLSSARWTPGLQERLVAALAARPRPLVVANPDLVAPREDGLTLEPGLYAHDALDRTGCAAAWFGKPFGDGFRDALARLEGIRPSRVAMVGDTLHTDVLGGAAAGIGTVLVARHGLFAGRDVAGYVARSGIVPDVIVETT